MKWTKVIISFILGLIVGGAVIYKGHLLLLQDIITSEIESQVYYLDNYEKEHHKAMLKLHMIISNNQVQGILNNPLASCTKWTQEVLTKAKKHNGDIKICEL